MRQKKRQRKKVRDLTTKGIGPREDHPEGTQGETQEGVIEGETIPAEIDPHQGKSPQGEAESFAATARRKVKNLVSMNRTIPKTAGLRKEMRRGITMTIRREEGENITA